jgi:hypothetical protein
MCLTRNHDRLHKSCALSVAISCRPFADAKTTLELFNLKLSTYYNTFSSKLFPSDISIINIKLLLFRLVAANALIQVFVRPFRQNEIAQVHIFFN